MWRVIVAGRRWKVWRKFKPFHRIFMPDEGDATARRHVVARQQLPHELHSRATSRFLAETFLMLRSRERNVPRPRPIVSGATGFGSAAYGNPKRGRNLPN